MKLICDCGNTINFVSSAKEFIKEDGQEGYNDFVEQNGEPVKYDYLAFDIAHSYEFVWITCQKCGKSICI